MEQQIEQKEVQQLKKQKPKKRFRLDKKHALILLQNTKVKLTLTAPSLRL